MNNVPLAYAPGTTTTTITVQAAETPARLDLFLSQKLPYYSRTFFKDLIEQGHITIGGIPATKASVVIKPGDIIAVYFPELALPEVTAQQVAHLDVKIVYQNEHFLIVNKPAGLTVHTPGAGHTELTLVDWLLHYFHEIKAVGSADRPGIVHRLDKDTSGLMIVARNSYAHEKLSDLFKDRKIKKTYLAVVKGHPVPEGTIDFNITRHPTNRVKMTHSSSLGRDAVTHYTVKEYLKDAALIEAKPVTGRTHQIRVHATALGHPLLGDALYGTVTPLIKRQALHAYQLDFTFEGKEYHFTQEMPEDMQELVKKLKKGTAA